MNTKSENKSENKPENKNQSKNQNSKTQSSKTQNAISPTRAENYPEWYQEIVKAADLADQSPVRGCMVIRPWGYAIWENIQRTLDKRFKETGHQNAYFPLFIPKSFLEKEAEHVEGFAKECAVVTHHRLEKGPDGGLIPAGPLSEPYIVRPTSETIIGAMFAKWIRSYRDLPLLINQWANVVRWEMRTRPFLRTAEFLWQEGHTVHATAEDAREETMKMLHVYRTFCEEQMAIPIIIGEKTSSERFPGADNTYSMEPMMQDRKALQAGTSHFLGQNFAKVQDIMFLDQNGKQVHAWTTSWGVSTRLIGALAMTHADDNGMIVPPRIAPTHVVIIPMLNKAGTENEVLEYCHSLCKELREKTYNVGSGANSTVQVEVDMRDLRGGEKVWSWIKKGAPICMEVGPRDVSNRAVFFNRRDNDPSQKTSMSRDEFVTNIANILDDIQKNLFDRALKFQKENTKVIDSKEEFYKFFTPKNSEQPEIHGGFAYTHWCGDPSVEEKVKADLGVTIRCIPIDYNFENSDGPGTCPFTGRPSERRVIFAKSY
ncbi:MAG: proline--tRNA ligase [Oligoflexia bacterium]|nr:proline--tRNA ligase [Oligoflexia bacterium]